MPSSGSPDSTDQSDNGENVSVWRRHHRSPTFDTFVFAISRKFTANPRTTASSDNMKDADRIVANHHIRTHKHKHPQLTARPRRSSHQVPAARMATATLLRESRSQRPVSG
ncbi:hypothetical protein NL676_036910 [Syzygium grande]|nr:hypothetical protein NL676_036910 [Syzygium grande]